MQSSNFNISSYLGIAVGGCHQIDNCTRFKSGIRRSVQFQISSDQPPLLGKIICRNYSVEYLVSLEKNVLANSSYITVVGLVIIWSHRSIMRADGQTLKYQNILEVLCHKIYNFFYADSTKYQSLKTTRYTHELSLFSKKYIY